MSPVDHVFQKCRIVIHEAPPIISNSYNLNNILKASPEDAHGHSSAGEHHW